MNKLDSSLLIADSSKVNKIYQKNVLKFSITIFVVNLDKLNLKIILMYMFLLYICRFPLYLFISDFRLLHS